MLNNNKITTFLTKNKFHLSEWFGEKTIKREGEFVSTQPANTKIPQSVTFCESRQFIRTINNNKNVTCVITIKSFLNQFDSRLGIIVTEKPRTKFYKLHNSLSKEFSNKSFFNPCIKRSAKIHKTAFVAEDCYIGENVEIGPGVLVLSNSYIEDEVYIGPNVVIGADGLEYKRLDETEKLIRIAHIGGVYLETEVEIKANTVVCRDVYFGFTVVGEGTKIGPLCNIAHRSNIGNYCMIAGNSTIGGSARIGDMVWLGPSSTISDNICVGDHAKVSLGSVVVKDVKPGQTVSGNFALDHSISIRDFAKRINRGQ